MKPDIRIGWFLICILALLALGLAVFRPRTAHGALPTLSERVEAVAARYGSRRDPPVATAELAMAVVHATKSREWAALLLAIAIHETQLSARLANGSCKPYECDHGLAWGLWQIHKNTRNAGYWGSTDLTVQAGEASHLARGAFYRCRDSGVPFPLGTFRAYAGRACNTPIKGEDDRVATYNAILRRL